MSAPVGFVGLGVLGSAIAENLVAAGHALLGVDARPEAVAAVAGVTPAALGDLAGVGVVFTCLPHADALRAVIAGLEAVPAHGQAGGQLVVELSTLSIADKEAARDALEAQGRHAMDCPVSGNRIMALKRGLTAFASGSEADFARAAPLLEAFCRKVHHVGEYGNGSKVKFAGNILNLVHNAVAAEAMVVAMKSGLDPKLFHEVISGSGSSSAMFEVRGRLMAENDYAAEGMNMSVPLKDAPLISEHAARLGVPLQLYQTGLQLYRAAEAQGFAHLDAAVVCRVLERMANCERPEAAT